MRAIVLKPGKALWEMKQCKNMADAPTQYYIIVMANCKGWSAHLFPAASIYSHSLPVLISHNLAVEWRSLRDRIDECWTRLVAIEA